ncbi:MAG TPA: hypothetical protein G4O01_06990 [Dehalococcoidia bacterium]|jgi:hypothetical protein|nr:hypothetical protein [Dehalococcoidia bacterium]
MIARAPTSGYEVSIYTTNLSPLVWVFLIAGMGGSIFLLVSEALNRDNESNRWLLSFFILAFGSLIVLLLPALKGYLMYGREDALHHLGLIKDTISQGHFADYNFYPVLHVFSAALARIIGLSAEEVILYLLPIFSLSYIFSAYFLAKSIFQKEGQVILATALGAIPLLPHSGLLSASNLPALMFPLVLALLVRTLLPGKSFSWTLLFILILVLAPYLHPLATMALMITLLVSYLLQAVANHKFGTRWPVPFNFLFVLAAVSSLWYTNFFIFNKAIEWAIRLFTWDMGTSPIPKIMTELGKIKVEGLEIVTLAFKMYGGEIISGVLAVVGVVLVIRWFTSGHREMRVAMLPSSLLIVFSSIYFAYYAGLGFGLEEAYSRFTLYVPIVAIIPAAFALYEIIGKYGYAKLLTLLAACLIVISAALSIFNKYPSPYRYQPNSQVTRAEFAGTHWIVSSSAPAYKATYIATPLFRYCSGVHGASFARDNSIDPGFPYRRPILIPDHFNYQNYRTLGESFAESGYMMLSEFDRLLYQYAWKRVGRFKQEDFARLEQDPTIDRLYTNGEFDVWFVWSVRSATPSESE